MCSVCGWVHVGSTVVFGIALIVFGIIYGVHVAEYKHYEKTLCTVTASKVQQVTCRTCGAERCYDAICFQADYWVNGTYGVAETPFRDALVMGPKRSSTRDADADIRWALSVQPRDCWFDTKSKTKATFDKVNVLKWLPAVIVFATATLATFVMTMVYTQTSCSYKC